jgi:hypothetical protein
MPDFERTRQVVVGDFGLDDLQQKLSEGWKAVAIEWERKIASQSVPVTAPAPEVPYGLRVSGDCAAELNRRGYRTRNGQPWTPISVFQMLPRLIEAGPGILNSDEWRQRRMKLKSS